MTDLEKKICRALQLVYFLPGSFDKKFGGQLPNWYEKEMTEKGKAKMIEMLHKYRKQIRNYESICFALYPEKFKKQEDLFGSGIVLSGVNKNEKIIGHMENRGMSPESKPLGQNDCSQCGEAVEEEHVRIQLTHPDGYQNVLRFHNLCYLANCDELLDDLKMCGVKMIEL